MPQTSSLRDVIGPSGLQIEPPRFGAALPPPNIAGPLRLSRPRLTGDAAYPQFAPVLDSSTNLRIYFSRPGYFYLTPGEPPPHLLTPRAYGLVFTQPFGDTTRLSGLLDAGHAQARLSMPAGDGRCGPVAGLGDNYLYLGGNYTTVTSDVLSTVNAGIVAWRNSIGLTGRYADVNLATGAFGMAGGSASRSMERALRDLGVYSGPDAAAIGKGLGLPPQAALRRVMYRTRRGIAGSVFAGAGHVLFAVQGRMGLAQRQERLLHTHMGQRRAHNLLCNDRGVRNRARSFGRCWGLRRDNVLLPRAHLPQSLRLGDELVNTRSRTGIVGVSAGSLAAWFGTQLLRQGDREIRLRRLGSRLYELGATPTRVRGVGLFGASALGPQISVDFSQARTLRQAFTFDTRVPSAHRLLVRGVDKSLPGNLPDNVHAHHPSRRVIARYYHKTPEVLPRGVQRSYAHAIEARELRLGGGIHFYIWPREWLPQGWTPGLMCHRIRGRETQAVHEGTRLTLLDSRGSETRSELFWRGIRSERVAATVYRLAQDRRRPRMQGLHLDCVIARSCQPLRSTNKQIVARLNRYFGLCLGRLRKPASTRRRQIALGRVLDCDEVDALVPYARHSRPCPLSETWRFLRQSGSASQAGISWHRMHRFACALGDASSLDRCAAVVQRFVQHHELRGFTAIHRLAGGGPKTLSLDTTTQSYAETIKHAAHTQLRYYRGVRSGRAIAEVLKALKRVGLARHKLLDDPLISAHQRTKLLLTLRDAKVSLRAVLRVGICEATG